MSAEKMKAAREALFKRVRRGAAQARDDLSRAFDRAGSFLTTYRDEIAKRTAPVAAAARRALHHLAEIARPATRPVRLLVGKVAPIVARAPMLIGAIGLTVVAGIASAIEWARLAVAKRLLPALQVGLASASDALTPVRIGVFCCLVAAGLLIGSQFLDYRGVAVGAALYKGQIAVDAPAPITATAVTGGAHFWVIIPIALVAVIASIAILRTGNKRIGGLICALGLIAIAISLAIDLPKALDPVHALPYSDASIRLLGGFWAELFAGMALVVSGGVLMRGNAAKPSRSRPQPIQHSADLATAGGR